MRLTTFLHHDHQLPTTLSEIRRVHDWVATKEFLGVFAYATQSGVSSFDLGLGSGFWGSTPSKWLFGIDYGRTQPQALRSMCNKSNTDVRIVDGAWLINPNGFIPRRDFHAKLSLFFNPESDRFGAVIGSGNFSSNGLRKSIEAGTALCSKDRVEYARFLEPTTELVNSLWESATPAVDILDDYEVKWGDSFSRHINADNSQIQGSDGPKEIFWIEAGYVTRNREDRPGNQIDLPRGMAKYFGFNPPDNLARNSVIGRITFETPVGESVTRNLRLGPNLMEKITLPIPETHGFDIYDGKILVFQHVEDRFILRALEADDFETAFGDRLSGVRAMSSGRRYGHLV